MRGSEWRWDMIALTAGMLVYPAYLGAKVAGFWYMAMYSVVLGLCFAYVTRRETAHIPQAARILFSVVWASFLVAVGYGAGRLLA